MKMLKAKYSNYFTLSNEYIIFCSYTAIEHDNHIYYDFDTDDHNEINIDGYDDLDINDHDDRNDHYDHHDPHDRHDYDDHDDHDDHNHDHNVVATIYHDV